MTTKLAIQIIAVYNSKDNWPFNIQTIWGDVFGNKQFPIRNQPVFDGVEQVPDFDVAKKELFNAATEHIISKIG